MQLDHGQMGHKISKGKGMTEEEVEAETGSEEDEGEGDIKLQVMHCVFRIMCESVESVIYG